MFFLRILINQFAVFFNPYFFIFRKSMLNSLLFSLSKLKWSGQPLQGLCSRPPVKQTAVRSTHNTNAAHWIIHDPVGLPLEENCTIRANVYYSSPAKLPVWCYGKWQHVGVIITCTQQGEREPQNTCIF